MSEQVQTNGYPILEWDQLQKGQTLGAVECAQAMGVGGVAHRSPRRG